MCVVDVKIFPGYTPLIVASINDQLPVMECLLEHKANIEAKDTNGVYLNFATAVLSGLHVCDCRMCLWMLMCVLLMQYSFQAGLH